MYGMLLKHSAAVRHLNGVNEAKLAVLGWFTQTDKSFYTKAFQALVARWDTCIKVAEE